MNLASLLRKVGNYLKKRKMSLIIVGSTLSVIIGLVSAIVYNFMQLDSNIGVEPIAILFCL